MSDKKIKGIWGWLLVYTLFLSLRLIIGISIAIIFKIVTIILIIETVLITIALVSIFIKSRNAKTINITYLSITVIMTIIAYFSGITSDNLQDRANAMGAIVGALAASIAWSMYLINSKRVKNTFAN